MGEALTLHPAAWPFPARRQAARPVSAELDLVRRHRAGDPRAFEEIYASYADLVFNLVARLAGRRDEAADLAQEVFLRLHRYLGSFRGESSLKTWIYRVTLNHCRSRLRRRLPLELPLETQEGGAIDPPDERPTPEERALRGDQTRRIERALAALPLKFRVAVVLRDVEGLDYAEIATALGVPVGTVRSRLARGRDQLRTLLEGKR